MVTLIPKARYLPSAIIFLLATGLCARSQQIQTPQLYRLSLPDKKWALQFTLPTVDSYVGQTRSELELARGSFAIIIDRLSKNGNYDLFAIQVPTKGEQLPFLALTLSPLSEAQTAIDLRTFALKKVVRDVTNIKLSEHNSIPIARYTNRPITFSLPPTIQTDAGSLFQNLEAYLVKDDVWARLTFTAARLHESDEQQFYSLLDSMSFVDVSKPSTSLDHYQLGRLYYLQTDYARAAEAFERAVQLEQQQKTLDVRSWRDLITKTAGAEATRGRADLAVRVLEYGISEEPGNTNFLMVLARVYASMKDVQRTLATLRTTFAYIRQGNKKADLPDLNRDPAFKELMKDESFRESVKALKKEP